jgi:hypothetical protein
MNQVVSLKRGLLGTLTLSGILLGSITAVFAVQPSQIQFHDELPWSKVLENSQNHLVVHDRHSVSAGLIGMSEKFWLVSSWSREGIQLSYTTFTPIWTGTTTVCSGSSEWGGGQDCSDEDTFRPLQNNETIKALQFYINGKLYTYKDGPVPSDLAVALASLPNKNFNLELVLENNRTVTLPIGSGTVRAWREIFG